MRGWGGLIISFTIRQLPDSANPIGEMAQDTKVKESLENILRKILVELNG